MDAALETSTNIKFGDHTKELLYDANQSRHLNDTAVKSTLTTHQALQDYSVIGLLESSYGTREAGARMATLFVRETALVQTQNQSFITPHSLHECSV
ncbi:hypothetical protein J6590_039561 [Homalodisca vitripennis]|nr:hypothetical protein J6590_039561 [Homalodisca vitripennis]